MKVTGNALGALQFDSAFTAFDEMLAAIAHQRCFAAFVAATMNAANISICELQNPAASGKNLYLFLGDIWCGVAQQMKLTFGGTSLAPAGVPISMFDGSGVSIAKVGGGNQLAPTGTAFIMTPSVPANTSYLLPPWFWCAIPPGGQLQVQASAVNVVINAHFRWIELSA
jgi:hypothetical protein